MVKWEYDQKKVTVKEFNGEHSEWLNLTGEEGWELINILPQVRTEQNEEQQFNDFEVTDYVCVFKRPAED
ncbi:DUF4177 domain-containing protein [Shouchella rhizosphaerae]|uniref:DUF4177 domain-containing protein n=1 Tax=Shouchella rhizosphaerae TaxID=866786 RepID=UPI003F815073